MLTYLLSPSFQCVNRNGKPLSGGHICVNLHDSAVDGDQGATVTRYITYSDFNGHRNPYEIPLDVNGMSRIIADAANSYDVYCYDSYGNPVWSRLNVKCVSIQSVTYEGDKVEVAGTTGEVNVTAETSPEGITTYTVGLARPISDATNIISSDNSVSVSSSTSAGTKTFDLSVNYPGAQYYCGHGRNSGQQVLGGSDLIMPIDADFYSRGISRSNNSLNLATGELYHCTAHISLLRTFAKDSIDRLWVILFGSLVYIDADASEMSEQLIEVSVDTLFAGDAYVKMGADASGWTASINLLCVHKVSGSGSGNSGQIVGANNRAMTMLPGSQTADVALLCPNSDAVFHAVGAMLLVNAPINMSNGLIATVNYIGGQLDTSHRICLYKADSPMSNDNLSLIAISREFHNPGWTSMHEETLYKTGETNMLEPGSTYYVVYALKGYTPIHVAGSEIVQGPSVPLVGWQLTTLETIPEHLEYGLWLINKVPFISIRANA